MSGLMWKKILVFAAHPDDDVIGVGGTIARLAKEGAHVAVVIFTNGSEGYAEPGQKDTIPGIREEETRKAHSLLGVKETVFLGQDDMDARDDKETLKRCIGIIREFRPDVIFTHSDRDFHRDHKSVSQVTKEASRQASSAVFAASGKPWKTVELYMYEVLNFFEAPSYIIGVSGTFDLKIEAIKKHRSQFKVMGDIVQLVEGLAKARGYFIGEKYGEAFMKADFFPVERKP